MLAGCINKTLIKGSYKTLNRIEKKLCLTWGTKKESPHVLQQMLHIGSPHPIFLPRILTARVCGYAVHSFR